MDTLCDIIIVATPGLYWAAGIGYVYVVLYALGTQTQGAH